MNRTLSDSERNTLRKAMRFSQLVYYAVFLLAVVMAFIGFKLVSAGISTLVEPSTQVIVKSISYLYLLLSIPFALWFYSRRVRAVHEGGDADLLRHYQRLVLLRILLIAVGFLGNILLFYLCQTEPRVYDFLFAAAIAAVALLFCKPREQVVENELFPSNLDSDD